ncbi:MAG: SDR family oxidoreductase [Verrucomicrobiales bacterium]
MESTSAQPENRPEETVCAVVTGGAGDLGGVIMKELRAAGWVCHAPGRAELDVTSPASVEGFFRGVKNCTLLVNCAGLTRDNPLARMDEAAWDEVMEADFRGAVRCARAVLPGMLRSGGGSILSIGSFSALAGAVGQTNYAAAKAALIGWTRSLALEYGRKNIRANMILPGFLETKMTRQLPEAVKQKALAAHALGRFTTVAESARAIVFLATCTHISGQVINLDSRIGDWG